MEDEEVSKEDVKPPISAEDNADEKTTEVTKSNMEKLQFLAEDNVECLQEQKSLHSPSISEGVEKYVPGQHPKSEVPLEEIRHRLLSLIVQGEEEEEEDTAIVCGRKGVAFLGEVQKISLISHTLAAFVGSHEESLVRRITLQISAETTLWINRMFRFFDSCAYFHRDFKEGLVRVVRLVLRTRYPKYSNNGYEALYTRPPVIYYNSLCRPGLEQHLSAELGLPVSSMVSVPSCSSDGLMCKMDITALEKLISEAAAATKIPLMIIACAGSLMLGQTDDLVRLQELCLAHNIWLHVDGHALSTLCLQSASNEPFEMVDSMTLCLGKWIGIPNLSSITLYKSQKTSNIHVTSSGQAAHAVLDSALPLWVTIQALGQENISNKISHCIDLTDYFLHQIESHEELHIIGKSLLKDQQGVPEDTDVKQNDKVPFDTVLPVVVFRYVQRLKSENGKKTSICDEKNPPYFDNLNSWLVQLLARNIPSVKTDILELDNYGVCLRVCFLETANVMNTNKKDINYYCSCLQHQLAILNATVKQRELLYKNHSDHRKLKLVQIKEWAGTGGARYVPEMWADRLNELTDTGKEDINNLNSELVAKLKASDSAFSVGEADDGMLCVRFGMVDEDLNMNELISLVISVGQEIEDSSKFLETMAEMVKHGIEEANKELVQENQEKLMQEGLLKQVPVIGSLVSWWYPNNSETGIKGRSFDLSSGTIESTENIYKYHMQIKEGEVQTPPPASKVLISPSQAVTSQNTTEHQSATTSKK